MSHAHVHNSSVVNAPCILVQVVRIHLKREALTTELTLEHIYVHVSETLAEHSVCKTLTQAALAQTCDGLHLEA